MKIKSLLILLFLGLTGSVCLGHDDVPVAISPGSNAGVGVVENRCPAFSWSGVTWAKQYRVVVFGVEKEGDGNSTEMKLTPRPVLSENIAGGGLSWTPSVSQALAVGTDYAWCVGAMDAGGAWAWSETRRFRVEESASRALSDDGQAGLKEKKDEAASDAVTGSSGEKAADKNELGNDPAHPLATEGTYNTFYGTGAGASNSGDENRNSFFGAGAGYYTSSGVQNTFLGYNAASDNTTGSYNTFVGAYAGDGNHAGSNNTFVGKNAGVFNYDAGGNTFMGASSGYATSSGSNNTFIGLEAGYMNTSGAGNTFVGVGSGYNNNASHNIFLGRYAGYNATGSRNVFLGSESGYNETGDDKLYIDNSNTTTPLIYGEFATDLVRINGLFAVTGTTSLTDTTVQGNLTVSDSISLDSGSTTISAPEINMLDGKTLATGAAGNDMLVTKGYVDESDDVGGGLTGNEMTDTYLCKWDDTNTRLVNSLLSETPEAVNINGRLGIGTPSPSGNLEVVTTGSNNVLAVTRTDGASFKLSAMGASGQIGTITAHPVNFMASNVKRLTISVNGNIGIGVTVPTYPLHMASGAYCSTGGVWTNSSSLALKENIASLSPEKAAAALQELRPVIYNYKADKAESCIGFIAEEVPELVSMNDRKSLSPMDIVAVLTKVVQEQQKAISALQRQVADLEKRSPEKMK